MSKVQTFIPDGSSSSQVAYALQNATVNNKLVDNINNEKILTKNVTGTDNFVVGKNNRNIYKLKKYIMTEAEIYQLLSKRIAESITESWDKAIAHLTRVDRAVGFTGKYFKP